MDQYRAVLFVYALISLINFRIRMEDQHENQLWEYKYLDSGENLHKSMSLIVEFD